MLLIMKKILYFKTTIHATWIIQQQQQQKGWWKDANTNKLQPDKAIVIDKTFLDQMDKNS